MQRAVFLSFLLWIQGLYGLAHPIDVRAKSADSLLPVHISWDLKKEQDEVVKELADIQQSAHLTRDARKTLARLMRFSGYKAPFLTIRTKHTLFLDLADVTARLKLYGIAMKCYYQSEHSAYLSDTPLLRQLSCLDTLPLIGAHDPAPLSPSASVSDILCAFDDGKVASSYALLVHVKQPVAGKRRSFARINNVGHMFITLIKYNEDSSVVCRSFGFYPHKSNLLSATPLHPSSPSIIRDDSSHEWDETAGKFISARRFKKILETLQSYDHKRYHLSHNNCTDFGLIMARLGGINIAATIGRWPLGKGSNPGSAGQSMLEGRLSNTDEDCKDPLFTSNNLLTAHR